MDNDVLRQAPLFSALDDEAMAALRTSLATTRLRETASPIAQIAFDVGYSSEASFSRAFKRVTGVTPGSIQRAAA